MPSLLEKKGDSMEADSSYLITAYRGGFERIFPYGRRVLKSIERMARALRCV